MKMKKTINPVQLQSDLLWEPRQVFWGARLQIAREFKELTQKALADKVVASPALISLCEAGIKTPSVDLVQAFGEVLGFETEFFCHEVEDMFFEEQCSFRHRRSAQERVKARIRAHATLIGMVIVRLRSLLKFPAQNIPHFPLSKGTASEVEEAAEACRKYWNLGIDGPIMQIGRVFEHAGVVIVPHLVKTTKIDAFSRGGQTAVIFLNKSIPSASRWNFDIAHEGGHLVMHPGIETGSIETEREADRFASAFLMPRKAFARDFSTGDAADWKHIFAMKRRWQTSAAAIIRRAYDLGLIDAVCYRKSYKHMSLKKWTVNGEPEEPAFTEPEILTDALTSLGTRVKTTLEELRQQLRFTPETFKEVTGVVVPIAKLKLSPVIPFSK
ncbi:MAG TPA: XRE family transcriptional regulator [Terriglobales bacterium]|jgi:Zn-dependent peptidase ImmA (M78 family)/DNA-binding XRE family transcriptional regulator